ncbi:MAG: TadE/TadG family type IV pilus assembly protein [Gemmobacter sp.]
MRHLGTHLRDESGATLVEYAIVMALFLFLLFGLIDFGRLANSVAMAEKAVHIAARTAIVRPPACAGVPLRHERGSATAPGYGTPCRSVPGACAMPAAVICTGSAGNATAVEIFNRVRPLLPAGSTIADLRFRYEPDPALGFLGGPYTPIVTVELADIDFVFTTPLGALAGVAGVPGSTLGGTVVLPTASVSLPAEDLAHGGS